VKAIAKTTAGPGLEIIETKEPQIKPGHVKVRIQKASICGTDLHIYQWDQWASTRIKPPRIIGHEFCGEIIEVGEGVSPSRMGEFISSESHIVCGQCVQCLHGQAHVCANTQILGVDVDGGFATYAVLPSQNARHTPPQISKSIASMQDAIGNAVHTIMSVPVPERTVLITGLGPIGLFAAAICKIIGAQKIYATEISPFRIALGKQIGVDEIFNPLEVDVEKALKKEEKYGVDICLEMSGQASSFDLAVRATRSGGEISILGVFPGPLSDVDMNEVVLKGLTLHGITGRRQWETWDQMQWLLTEKGLDLSPLITHEMKFDQIEEAMQILQAGQAGKIVLDFE
jgi:threonine 3-dehydrogenase